MRRALLALLILPLKYGPLGLKAGSVTLAVKNIMKNIIWR
jgi:hypothetical protein